MQTKPISTRFGGTFGKLRFDDFFTSLEFATLWHYKPIDAFHSDSPRVYTGEKNNI